MPPTSDMVADSMRNCDMTSLRRAPSALRTPISRVRSVTETSMMFMMTMPPTTSEMAASETKSEEAGADALPDADEGLVGIDGEAVFAARRVVPDGAKDDADLIDGDLQRIADPARRAYRVRLRLAPWVSRKVVSGTATQLSWLWPRVLPLRSPTPMTV